MSEEKVSLERSAGESPVYEAAPERRGFVGRMTKFYSKSMTQVALIGFCCFLCPGMFNALSGLGGGGQINRQVNSRANTALYACFAGVSSFAGTIHNKLGTRLTLFIGACGYSLYIASYISYNHNQNAGFVIASGAILGVCASLFWTAQGAVMLSYPIEQDKGKSFAIVWIIFNLGAVIGSAIELGLTYDSESQSLSDAPYIVFMVLSFLGACCAALLKKPSSVIRSDGTRVYVPAQTTWKAEFIGLYRLLKTDPWILLMFPLFFGSNFFNSWQQNCFNASVFTLRTRALNSLIYWFAQMVAAYLFSFVLDSKQISRRSRMMMGWAVVFCFMWAVWGGSYAEQLTFSRGSPPVPLVDLSHSRRYAGPGLLFAFSGFFDALWQAFAYSLMGAISNDMSKLAFLAGFYKSIQSAGGAAGFAMDSAELPFMNILGATWGTLAAAIFIVIPVLLYRVTDTTSPLSEITVPGREEEVKKATEEAIERTGVVPEQLKHMDTQA